MTASCAGGRPACSRWLLAALALLVCGAARPAAAQNTTAGEILLSFKTGITNWAAATGSFQGWTNPADTTCSWTGVKCNTANSVTGLNLARVGLVGPLPSSLSGLPDLQTLDLSFNQLTGSLSAAWGSHLQFDALQELQLTSNKLTGPLPTAWGRPRRWPALSNLQLGTNNFTGGLPATWAATEVFANLTALDLSVNGLSGALPAAWGVNGSWASLANLDLSNNSLAQGLPVGWGANGSFPVLAHLLLANNSLSGSLPPAWGGRASWPALTALILLNNNFSGAFPATWTTNTSWPALSQLVLQPGNAGLCGAVSTSTSYSIQYLSSTGTTYPVSGSLGTCATACGRLTTSNNATNLYDISVEAKIALADLLEFNPSANVNAPVAPGTSLTRPCYSANAAPSYLGGNIAYGKSASQSSTVGAGVAGLAVAQPQAGVNGTCSQTQPGTTDAPAWWMLDLGVSTDIVGVVIAATTAVGDLKISLGTSDNALTNAACQTGVQIEGNATSAQVCNGKGRYLVFSRLSGGEINLCGVEVFPVAANAAVSKRAFGSNSTTAMLATDGSDDRCAAATAQVQSTGAWLTVDLGYSGSLAAVGVDLGFADLMQLNIRVGDTAVATGLENSLCVPAIANLPGYSKTLFGCDGVGRYVTVQAPQSATLDLCLLSVFLQDAPAIAVNGSLTGVVLPPPSPLPRVPPPLHRLPLGPRLPAQSNLTSYTPASEAVTAPVPSPEWSRPNGLPDLTLAPGAVANPSGSAPALAPSPEALALSPNQMVEIQFRLVLTGPYVVDFDGKSTAVVNAVNATLQSVKPASIRITSYTVGAPVPASTPAPAPGAMGRRLAALDEDEAVDPEDMLEAIAVTHRTLQQQPLSGSVIINVAVSTTVAKETETRNIMQAAVVSGNFAKALNAAGLDAEAARISFVPNDAAAPATDPSAVPVPGGEVSAPGSGIPVPGSSSGGGGGGGSSGAAIGGGIAGGLIGLALLAVLAWWLLARRRRRQQDAAVAAAPHLAGGKGDIESASDTGSSTGGSGASPVPTGCWPFGRSLQSRPAHSVGSPGSEAFSDTAFLPKGGSGKLASAPVHAHARGGPMPSLAMRLAAARGTDVTLREAYSTPGTPGGHSTGTEGAPTDPYTDDPLLRSRGSGSNLLLPAGAFTRSHSSGLLGSPSGWETPLGMGPGGPDGPGFLSPEQQMALGGPLGLLHRGASDVQSEVEVIAEDPPPQRWTSHSAELWPIMYRELTFLKQIGEGSFGRVYMARWRETTVAVKVLHRQSADHQDDDLPLDPCPSAGSPDPILHALQKEAGIMASVRHPNVISYLGVCAEPACIVTEYCSKGSLTDVLRRGRVSGPHAAALDWPRRLNMAMDAAKGMLHLHLCDPPIIHRDLKSPNLLVDKHWRLKVCDFNLSRVMEESVVLSSMVASNPRWLAPEILAGLPYTVAADVYSFGIIMWELLTWEVPWHQQNTWQVHAMVTVEHLRPDIPDDLAASPGGTFGGSDAYLDLMKDCWAQSSDDRPDFEHIIGRLRRMLAVETLARQPTAGSQGGSPSRNSDRHPFSSATASAPGSSAVSSPLATR